MELDAYLTSFTKINSKGIVDLNVEAKIIKLLGENMGVNLHDFGLNNVFLDATPKVQATTAK